MEKFIKQDIEAQLEALGIGLRTYTIHDDGTVDVDSNVWMLYSSITEIGIKFGKVTGDFDCSGCSSLTSLIGAPSSVGGYFNCGHCSKLVSLEGAPSFVGNYVSFNHCMGLRSLTGAPATINGNLYIYGCKSITSLAGIDTSIKKLRGALDCDDTVKSHVLGLTRIVGLTHVVCNAPWAAIVNEHLHHTLACQSALLDAGLNEYAAL